MENFFRRLKDTVNDIYNYRSEEERIAAIDLLLRTTQDNDLSDEERLALGAQIVQVMLDDVPGIDGVDLGNGEVILQGHEGETTLTMATLAWLDQHAQELAHKHGQEWTSFFSDGQ